MVGIVGPSGSGKNSTIDYLCSDLGITKIIPSEIVIEENDEDHENLEINYAKDLFKIFQYSIFWSNPQ